MTNATIATTAQPIAKLYRMCGKYNQHAACKGHFEGYSVCSCECHTHKDEPKAKKPAIKHARVSKAKAAPAPKISARVESLARFLRQEAGYLANFTAEEIAQARSLVA